MVTRSYGKTAARSPGVHTCLLTPTSRNGGFPRCVHSSSHSRVGKAELRHCAKKHPIISTASYMGGEGAGRWEREHRWAANGRDTRGKTLTAEWCQLPSENGPRRGEALGLVAPRSQDGPPPPSLMHPRAGPRLSTLHLAPSSGRSAGVQPSTAQRERDGSQPRGQPCVPHRGLRGSPEVAGDSWTSLPAHQIGASGPVPPSGCMSLKAAPGRGDTDVCSGEEAEGFRSRVAVKGRPGTMPRTGAWSLARLGGVLTFHFTDFSYFILEARKAVRRGPETTCPASPVVLGE